MEKNLSEEFGLREIGRLALRLEGENWVAYYALADTMQGAMMLGSIRMALVMNLQRKEDFMTLMQRCVSDILEDITGERPTWPLPPQRARESERSGRA
jgi:hypothetical protein